MPRSLRQRHPHRYNVTVHARTQDGRIVRRFYTTTALSPKDAKRAAGKMDRPVQKRRKRERVERIVVEDRGPDMRPRSKARFQGESFG